MIDTEQIRTDDIGPQVMVDDELLRVRFDRFGPASYELFLKVKRLPERRLEFDASDDSYTVTAPARFAPLLGLRPQSRPAGHLAISDSLFDDQRAIVRMALDAKRFACWSDCGLGKTIIGLEFSRHVAATGGRVLIVTLNEIVPQWIDEAARFYGKRLSVTRLDSRQQIARAMTKLEGAERRTDMFPEHSS